MASNGKHHQAFLYMCGGRKFSIKLHLRQTLSLSLCVSQHSLDKGIAHQSAGVREEGNDNQINVAEDACDFFRTI